LAEEHSEHAAQSNEDINFVVFLVRPDGQLSRRKVTIIPKSKAAYPTGYFRNAEAFRALVQVSYRLTMKVPDGGNERLQRLVVNNINGMEIEVEANKVFDVLNMNEAVEIVCYFESKKRN